MSRLTRDQAVAIFLAGCTVGSVGHWAVEMFLIYLQQR